MSSGARVVLVLFAAVLAVALIAVAAFLLTDEPNLLCVEGELQDNQVDAQGRYIPRVETFADLPAAEAFICHRIPHPRDSASLQLDRVVVTRDTNLGNLVEGTGAATVALDYAFAGGPSRLTLSATLPANSVPPVSGGEEVPLQGTTAKLQSAPDGSVYVIWDRGSFHFVALGRLDGDFDLPRLLAVLESVR